MSIFLTDNERRLIAGNAGKPPLNRYYWALLNRASKRAEAPGLRDLDATPEWWYFAAEYLTDGAMACALKPSEQLRAWVRDVTLALVRRPEDDWVGPWFRDHGEPKTGQLETAHLAWSTAVALDLCPNVFTEAEADEVRGCLHDRAIPMCRRWLERNRRLVNWTCVLNAGLAVPAAVIGDKDALNLAESLFSVSVESFQPDGSHGESLQYANYAAYTCMLTCEALLRSGRDVTCERYAGYARWAAHSLFYCKPLAGWGQMPRPRNANFNDSAAIAAPSPDLLLHIAARNANTHLREAKLARWLVDTVYTGTVGQGPQHSSTFGIISRFGFLTLPLLPQACEGAAPAQLDEPLTAAFSCGDVLARDAWDGRTVLAVHGGGDPLCSPAHLHGDLNSFILVHNRERLLVDPGHSCYRGLIHGVETGTETHNTCSFEVDLSRFDTPEAREHWSASRILVQSTGGHRSLVGQQPGPPMDRGARRLLCERRDEVTIIGSEAAALYGAPITEFARFWFLCGPHALFVVDRVTAETPVFVRWHWLLNNRDDGLDLKLVPPDRLVARRGDAGLKIFHTAGGRLEGMRYAFVHDAYHPLPNQHGEGRSGSGRLLTWRSADSATAFTAVHALAMDDYGSAAGWHFRNREGEMALEAPGATQCWTLKADDSELRLCETGSGRLWTTTHRPDGSWIVKPS